MPKPENGALLPVNRSTKVWNPFGRPSPEAALRLHWECRNDLFSHGTGCCIPGPCVQLQVHHPPMS